MARLARAPLFQMLVLGGLLFGADRLFRGSPGAQRAALAGLAPADLEEEVLYREALALGLDRDDVVVRRRLAQKLRTILGHAPAPTEDELKAYLDAHRGRYDEPPRWTFDQLWIADGAAGETLAALASGAAPEGLGRSFPHGRAFRSVTTEQAARIFGLRFAAELVRLEVGGWHGPVPSSYGAHLVRVVARDPGRPAELEAVRDRLRRDWEHDARQAAEMAGIAKLTARYLDARL